MVELEFAQIDPVDQDTSLFRVPEAQQQIGERRLPGARRPDDRDRRAGRYRERDPVERRTPCAGIGEGHIVEPDRRAADRSGRPRRAVAHRRFFMLHGVIAPCRGDRVGELAADLRDLGNRQERGERQQDQQRQCRRREAAVRNHPGPDDRDREPAEPGRDFELRGLRRQIPQQLEPGLLIAAHRAA